MVAHEKRNSAQLFCAVPTRNDLALSSLLFPAQPTQKLGYPKIIVIVQSVRLMWSTELVRLSRQLLDDDNVQRNQRV